MDWGRSCSKTASSLQSFLASFNYSSIKCVRSVDVVVIGTSHCADSHERFMRRARITVRLHKSCDNQNSADFMEKFESRFCNHRLTISLPTIQANTKVCLIINYHYCIRNKHHLVERLRIRSFSHISIPRR